MEEGDGQEEDNDRIALGLVGKLWTTRVPYPGPFIATMKSIWMVKNGIDISNIGRNLFQIQFYHWRDKKKILDGQP